MHKKMIKGNAYYYAQRSWREKLPADKPGGKSVSKVRSEMLYLGTVESLVKRIRATRAPVEVRHRDFGFVAAIWQCARQTGLEDLLRTHIAGTRCGVPRWLYFMLPIINRLQHATSKQQMGKWAKNTVLPELLHFDPERLNSKSFWYATDDVISEKELRRRREEKPEIEEELFAGLDDKVFARIEEELAGKLREKYGLFADTLLYDTTNFFTYIEEPVRSKMARTGHNKEARHHLRQIGLSLCVDKEWGIPLFYRLYRGNAQDAKTFSGIVEDLVRAIRAGCESVEKLVLVLDKGNNSKENFQALDGKLDWVGSLTPTHHNDLLALPLEDYEGTWQDCKYHSLTRKVMGIDCTLVLTYSDLLARKQTHGLENGINKLERHVLQKWNEYKNTPSSVPKGIASLLKQSRYGNYLQVDCIEGKPVFSQTPQIKQRIAEQKKRFGKNLLFANGAEAQAPWIIEQYRKKDRVEDGFKLLKHPEIIRWRPCRHWTDTKIRAFGFCCVMALILIRVMERETVLQGIPMSPQLIKEELDDIKEVIMVYDDHTVQTQITHRSAVQNRLWDIFELETVYRQLTQQTVTA